jgi:hypothetical protein
MEKYHGIVIAKDVFFGTSRVFYTTEQENLYRTDVSNGRLADKEEHVVWIPSGLTSLRTKGAHGTFQAACSEKSRRKTVKASSARMGQP